MEKSFGTLVCLAHKLPHPCPRGPCGPTCPSVRVLCPARRAVTVLKAGSPGASVQAALGGQGLLDLIAPLQLLSCPRSQKGFPRWRRPSVLGPSEAVRVLDSACPGARSSGLSKLYRLTEGASQHSPGAQISCLHHFLAAWPHGTPVPARGNRGS